MPPPKAPGPSQLVAGSLVLVVLVSLAVARFWPFDADVALGQDPSLAEVTLGDRLTVGLIPTAVVAVVGYLVVSIPALIIDRRWIQGLTTTGLTADAARDRGQESVEHHLAAFASWAEGKYDTADELKRVVDSLKRKLDETPGGGDGDR
ncbi:MAG: hypothetical protein M3134_00610 [Actinomycetota bacterium]|nr:hypothetical protein [Actinomycetota bacterium]